MVAGSRKPIHLQGASPATNQDSRPSKVLRLSVDRCFRRKPFLDERWCAAHWRCWLAPRCCILQWAGLSSTNIRMGRIPPAIFAKRCICRHWRLRRSTWSVRPRSSLGILRCRSTQRQAIPSRCIAPAAPLLHRLVHTLSLKCISARSPSEG
jgi:hypothetical protein